MTKPDKHIHRLVRVVMGKNGYTVFKCDLPCKYFISAKLAEGKLTICHRCGRAFILDKRAMKLVKPHCVDCIQVKKKEDPEFSLIEEFLEKKGI